MALDEQRCVESEGLTICPAGMATRPPDATPTPTGTPLPSAPSPSPTSDVIDMPTATPSIPPAQMTATAAPSTTPTVPETSTPIPTPTVDVGMTVDTSFDSADGPTCVPTDTPGICILPFTFVPQGFSVDTHYQVAARSNTDEPWELFDAVAISFDAPATIFATDIPIDTQVQSPNESVVIQTAVLVFVDESPLLPAMEIIESLAESGANFAFVNPLEDVAVIP
jgi:hypothetical protein